MCSFTCSNMLIYMLQYAHLNAPICSFKCSNMLIYMLQYAHLHAPICSFTCSNMLIYMLQYAHLHAPICSFTCSNMLIYMLQYAHLHAPICSFTCSNMLIYMLQYAHLHAPICSFTCSNMLTIPTYILYASKIIIFCVFHGSSCMQNVSCITMLIYVHFDCTHNAVINCIVWLASSPGSLFRQRAWSLISRERTQKSANINERGCNKPHAHEVWLSQA